MSTLTWNSFKVRSGLLKLLSAHVWLNYGQRAMRPTGKHTDFSPGQCRRSQENLMPLFIDCVENALTLGEICGVLRRGLGEYQPPITL